MASVDICNSALIKIGVSPITALTDNNKAARLCNLIYDKLRRKLLISHYWNFARGRARLTQDTFDFVDGDVTTGTDNINHTAHGRVTGERLDLTTTETLPTGLSSNVEYFIVRVDDDNFKISETYEEALAGTVIDITAAAGGGTHTYNARPAFEYDRQFLLPSDYLRGEKTDNEFDEFKIEKGIVVTSSGSINLIYIADITDTDEMTETFKEALAYLIGSELAIPLTQNVSMEARMKDQAKIELKDVRSADAQEGTPESLGANAWVDARQFRGSPLNRKVTT